MAERIYWSLLTLMKVNYSLVMVLRPDGGGGGQDNGTSHVNMLAEFLYIRWQE